MPQTRPADPLRRDYDIGMAFIGRLRELDTERSFSRMCDQQELYERRRYMDGDERDSEGGVCWQSINPVAVELLRQDSDSYFTIVRKPLPEEAAVTATPASWSGEWDPLIQLTIRRLVQPSDLITVYNGPDQFPSVREVRGPLQSIRYQVWRDALGTAREFDETSALDAIEWLTADERATVLDHCAFIRERTVPIKQWQMPDNPLLGADHGRLDQNTVEDIRRSRFRTLDELWPAGSALDNALTIPDPFAETAEDPTTPQRPALPRPSHTPPPWANNPSRTRRNKYGPTRRVK